MRLRALSIIKSPYDEFVFWLERFLLLTAVFLICLEECWTKCLTKPFRSYEQEGWPLSSHIHTTKNAGSPAEANFVKRKIHVSDKTERFTFLENRLHTSEYRRESKTLWSSALGRFDIYQIIWLSNYFVLRRIVASYPLF